MQVVEHARDGTLRAGPLPHFMKQPVEDEETIVNDGYPAKKALDAMLALCQ